MAGDLAAANIKAIEKVIARSESVDEVIVDRLDEARAAYAVGETKQAITISSQILERLKQDA